jgi:hypothetical protein
MTFGIEESLLDDLKLRNVPLVVVDVGPARPRVGNIRIDYLHGIRQRQYVAALRHEKIAFITGLLNDQVRPREKRGVRSVDERDWDEAGAPIDCRRGSHSGGQATRVHEIMGFASKADGDSLLERHDRHRGDARELWEKDPHSRRIVGDWIRQYSPGAVHPSAFDNDRDVASATRQAGVSGAAERRARREAPNPKAPSTS